MMIYPSEEQRKLTKLLDPWLYATSDSHVPKLKKDAPKEVRDAYQIFLQKYMRNFI